MDYNNIVSSLRELARDELRLKTVNLIRSERLSVQTNKSSREQHYEDYCQRTSHFLAVVAFKVAQVNEADPDKEMNLKALTSLTEATYKEQEERAVDFAKDIEDYNKALSEMDERIAKVQSGETKVSQESLTEVTNRLIKEVTTEAATSLPLTEKAV